MNISRTFRNKLNIKALRKSFSVFALLFLFLGASASALSEIDQINQQINQLNQSIDDNNSKKQTVEVELSSIDAQTEAIKLQVLSTQLQLDDANNQISSLKAEIAIAENNLTAQKTILGEYIRQMYINGQSSQVQLILTSSNFSDFIDKSQYLDSMQQKVKGMISNVEATKKELEEKKQKAETTKEEIGSLMSNQIAQKNALESQQAYRNEVISGLIASNDSLADQKEALFVKKANLSRVYGETLVNGSTSYPWGNPTPDAISCDSRRNPTGKCTVDNLGYYIGQCTSYVAWRRKKEGFPIPPAIGNGGEWTGSAAGYSQSYLPEVGDAMIFPSLGGFGHVAYVESVYPSGNVYISEYNWKENSYTEREVNPVEYSAYFIHTY